MSTDYEYSIALDFPNGLDQPQLQKEIVDSGYITAAILGITTSGDVVTISFNPSLSNDEETELNNIIALHNPISGDKVIQQVVTLSRDEYTTIDHATDLNDTRVVDVYYTNTETFDDKNLTFHEDFASDYQISNSTVAGLIKGLFTLKSVGYTAGTNVATTYGAASASSATQPASNALDGGATTIWYNALGTTTNGQTFTVNLGKSMAVYSAQIVWYSTAYYATSVRFECSSNGETWDLIDNFTGVTYTGASPDPIGTYTFVFPTVSHCQYYRATFLSCISSRYIIIREFKLFEAVGSGFAANTPAYITNIPANRKVYTTLWDTINSGTIYYTRPVGTSIKIILSFDSQNTFRYWNGSSWASTSLVNIESNSMTPEVFNALTDANYRSANGFLSGDGSISCAVSITTTNTSLTPSVDKIVFNVTTKAFKQSASRNDVQIRLVTANKTEIKNLMSAEHVFTINVKIN